MKTEFDVSFEKNGVCQERIIVAKNKDFAERWFRMIEPEAVVLGISENYEYKPGEPVEEVPYEWNGIVFDDVFDDEYSSERILYFDVPLEYLGKDYFDEEDSSKAVGATVAIFINSYCPTYEEADFEVSPTDADGHDFDWLAFEMSREEFKQFMRIADEPFTHPVNVGFSTSDTEHDETQFDLEDPSDTVELVNLIVQFFAEKHFDNPVVTYIEEA